MGIAIRKDSQPIRTGPGQPWASDLVESSHAEALYAFGEYVIFTLMWRPKDFEMGLVGRCQTCFVGTASRQAAAFQQPTKRECPDCYGTTYEGGFRAQIIRPALLADRNQEVSEENRGVVVTDTIQMETTSDFRLHKGDYVFRGDNTRFQTEEKNEAVVRTGFGAPLTSDSSAGTTTAHREETTSVAFLIPPLNPTPVLAGLTPALGTAPLAADLDQYSTIRPHGYLIDPDDSLANTPSPLPDPPPAPVQASGPHRVSVAASTWTWVHNLSTRPDVLLFIDSDPGEAVYTDVSYPDENTVVVEWPSPESGWIYLG